MNRYILPALALVFGWLGRLFPARLRPAVSVRDANYWGDFGVTVERWYV
jgi:hypothetical protein